MPLCLRFRDCDASHLNSFTPASAYLPFRACILLTYLFLLACLRRGSNLALFASATRCDL